MSEDEWMDVHHYFHASKSEDEKEKRMMTFKGLSTTSGQNISRILLPINVHTDIQGYGMGFSNIDLLERHVVQRHPGWTAYPGQLDLDKYREEQKEKGQVMNG